MIVTKVIKTELLVVIQSLALFNIEIHSTQIQTIATIFIDLFLNVKECRLDFD